MSSRRVVMNYMTRNHVARRPRNAASLSTATQGPLRRFARPITARRRLPYPGQLPRHANKDPRAALAGLAVVTGAVCLSPLLRFELMDTHLVNKGKNAQQSPPSEITSLGYSSTVEMNQKYLVDWKEPVLGLGTFGSVHLCHSNNKHEEPFALKRIQKKRTNAAAFRREVDALQKIRKLGGHQNIVALRDLFEDDEYYYLVMDLAQGGEVFEDLVQHGAYSEEQAARMILQLASALKFLHENVGLVHADLKLENLLLLDDSTTNVALADFGCAFPVSPSSTEEAEKMRLSASSSGTLAYWSPERFEETQPQAVTPAMDMWSVGILLYILLANAHPFDPYGTATESQIRCNIRAFRTSPAAPAGGPLLQDLLQRLLARNPSERMTAAELIQHPWIRQHTEAEHVKQQHQDAMAHPTTAPFSASLIVGNLMAASL